MPHYNVFFPMSSHPSEIPEPAIDRERPVITGIARFSGKRIDEMAALETPHMARGVQFGLGRGDKPISHFPGGQTWMRPLVGENKHPRHGVDEVTKRLKDAQERLARVTIKAEPGTDIEELYDTIEYLRAELSHHVEIVLASQTPDFLKRARDNGVRPDVVQHVIPQNSYNVAGDVIPRALKEKTFLPGAEVAFPLMEGVYQEQAERVNEALVDVLVEAGHDAYIRGVRNQSTLDMALRVIASKNFNLSAVKERSRIRGLYVEDPLSRYNFNIPEAQFMGITARG